MTDNKALEDRILFLKTGDISHDLLDTAYKILHTVREKRPTLDIDIGTTDEGYIEACFTELGVDITFTPKYARIQRHTTNYQFIDMKVFDFSDLDLKLGDELNEAEVDITSFEEKHKFDYNLDANTMDRLVALSELKNGWYGIPSFRPKRHDIHLAARLVEQNPSNMSLPEIGSSEMGEIELAWIKEKIICTIELNGNVSCRKLQGKDITFEHNGYIDLIIKIIKDLNN